MISVFGHFQYLGKTLLRLFRLCARLLLIVHTRESPTFCHLSSENTPVHPVTIVETKNLKLQSFS